MDMLSEKHISAEVYLLHLTMMKNIISNIIHSINNLSIGNLQDQTSDKRNMLAITQDDDQMEIDEAIDQQKKEISTRIIGDNIQKIAYNMHAFTKGHI